MGGNMLVQQGLHPHAVEVGQQDSQIIDAFTDKGQMKWNPHAIRGSHHAVLLKPFPHRTNHFHGIRLSPLSIPLRGEGIRAFVMVA